MKVVRLNDSGGKRERLHFLKKSGEYAMTPEGQYQWVLFFSGGLTGLLSDVCLKTDK